MLLGSSYDTNDLTYSLKSYYGDLCNVLESGAYYTATIYTQTNYMDTDFKRCTIYFYKNHFWKIVYEGIQSDARAFANTLEWNYRDYSTSDTNYEYKFGDSEMAFNGEDLRIVSDKVTKKIYDTIRGGY
jgi:hypothetical protein